MTYHSRPKMGGCFCQLVEVFSDLKLLLKQMPCIIKTDTSRKEGITMKNMKRLIALLLCLTLMTGLFGCSSTPQETAPPPTTEPAPTEPPADELYASACDLLTSSSKITLDVLTTTTTSVADQDFTIIAKAITNCRGNYFST